MPEIILHPSKEIHSREVLADFGMLCYQKILKRFLTSSKSDKQPYNSSMQIMVFRISTQN